MLLRYSGPVLCPFGETYLLHLPTAQRLLLCGDYCVGTEERDLQGCRWRTVCCSWGEDCFS